MSNRIATKHFSKDRDVLIHQIRWLLNEMDYTKKLIQEGSYDEATRTLSKEVDNNYWMSVGL